ncbi:MAG: AAA family ATPase [Clostridia bacterium]|nr:AAA family ATPase [Clostridia bacterium]
MKIWEFVITGGPCAGKTTCLSMLSEELTKKGYKVIVVPETATEVITSGITPWEYDEFQGLLIDRGLNKEETVRRAAEAMRKDIVILYDRGILDGKAYMDVNVFREELRKRGFTEIKIRDNYDAVFHLVTAAEGAEEFYTLENNKARFETPEEAKIADKKTRNAWIGHQHFRVIDNSTLFTEKVNRLIREVLFAMGLPIPLEIERKYLITKPQDEQLEKIDGIVKLNILQTYLHSEDPLIERRIRQRGEGNSFSYYYTEKKTLSNLVRQEKERLITQREYISLLIEGEKSIRKDRYCFLFKNQYFELDIYPKWDNEAILEIELTDKTQKVDLPDWIKVIKEVTEDITYKNINLAK